MNLHSKRQRPARRPVILAALAVLVLALLGGCSSAPNPVYYRVDFEPTTAPAPAGAGQLVLKLVRLSSTQPLTQPNIVHRMSESSLVFEPYSLWEAAPVDMAKRALVTGLRRSGFFKRVTTRRLATDEDLALRARLERFEWVSLSGLEQAQVFISFNLYDPATDKVVFSGQGQSLIKAKSKNLEAVAQAMTKALDLAVNQVVSQTVAQAEKFKK